MGNRLTHEEIRRKALSSDEVKYEYDSLEEEFILLEELIKARNKAQKTQADVAKLMGTTTSVVGRLETGGGKRKHSPSLDTLRRYAKAIDCELKITLTPIHELKSNH